MGDHFVLLVDRLLTESTLEAALESRNRAMQEAASSAVNEAAEVDVSLIKMVMEDVKSPRKIVECRICHDEDENSNMETPCSCCGSLKYAHRKCIQRWCNEKGDTICEICHQQYKPGYTAPPPLFQFGRIPMTFRGNWEISRRDLNHGHLVRMVSTNQNLDNSNYDQYSASTAGSLLCCRLVVLIVFLLCPIYDCAICIYTFLQDSFTAYRGCLFLIFVVFYVQFMVLLILRHTLPLIISGNKDYSFSLISLLLIQTAGIVIPIYFMVKAVTSIQRHRRQQQEAPNALVDLSDSESEQVALPSQLHIIRA